MEKKKRDKYNMAEDGSVVLNSELTGLVQTPPRSEDEARFYAEIAGIPSPIKDNNNGQGRNNRPKH